MTEQHRPKGPWINRFATRLFTLVLGVLIFWVLDFLVEDIRSIRGPQRKEIEERHIDQTLVRRSADLGSQIAEAERRIKDRKEELRVVQDSSQNLQRTMGQLIELQKLTVQKGVTLPTAEQGNLATSLEHFLQSQKQYQELNADLSDLMAQKRALDEEKRRVQSQISNQREPAHAEYNSLNRKHRLKLAALQLLVLVPLLALGAFLVLRRRGSIYFPLYLAFGGATAIKVTLVVHEYFPTRYFKYILIAVLLLAVGRALIHFIRVVAFPKAQWLAKQYRQAYERFLCPVCEYPVRIGPRRFLFWTRRTVNKHIPQKEPAGEEEIYTCPSCGTQLFESCDSCRKIRHALLPHCRHCGAEKEVG